MATYEEILAVSKELVDEAVGLTTEIADLKDQADALALDIKGLSEMIEGYTPPPVVKPLPPEPEPEPEGAYPGHIPGRVVLTMSAQPAEWSSRAAQINNQVGGRRFFEPSKEDEAVRQLNKPGATFWFSHKAADWGGSSTFPAAWQWISAGNADKKLEERALKLAAYVEQGYKIIDTFHHENSNDAADNQGHHWAKAQTHVTKIYRQTLGPELPFALAPIEGEWLWNPRSGQDANLWLTDEVLENTDFLGVDCYQNAGGKDYSERIWAILDWLEKRGFGEKMIGIGETGCTYKAGWKRDPIDWFKSSYEWAFANHESIGIISYFNSGANSKPEVFWPLEERQTKIDEYKRLSNNPIAWVERD